MGHVSFETFYSRWIKEEKNYVQDLRLALQQQKSQQDVSLLVQACHAHYQDYVNAKINAIQTDCLDVAAETWISPLEAGFLWMGGWRPTTGIILAYSLMGVQIESELHKLLEGIEVPSLAALSAKQLSCLNSLQQENCVAEDELSSCLARLQMSVADQQMVFAAMTESPISETNDCTMISKAIEAKLNGLRDIMVKAELLRSQTVAAIIDILTPIQAAQYAVAALEMTTAVKKLGSQQLDATHLSTDPLPNDASWFSRGLELGTKETLDAKLTN
ncbi:hypothetical protein O6H91_04G084300 [Diphasiastrum complanatum]|uniref:Uncharacterized protein n=1 Tax=Diphasiastrum complanatum TaxID=34168 RepID=A0ACC2DZ43_DIPCM|nr:hypothetical protein O6H91_04G084300 [Diphasiastrum complanatum]